MVHTVYFAFYSSTPPHWHNNAGVCCFTGSLRERPGEGARPLRAARPLKDYSLAAAASPCGAPSVSCLPATRLRWPSMIDPVMVRLWAKRAGGKLFLHFCHEVPETTTPFRQTGRQVFAMNDCFIAGLVAVPFRCPCRYGVSNTTNVWGAHF